MYLLHITKDFISKITHMFLIILLISIIFITSSNNFSSIHLQTHTVIEEIASSTFMTKFYRILSNILVWIKEDYKQSQLRWTVNTYKQKVIYFLNNIK